MLISCTRCGKIHERGQCAIKRPYRPKEATEITRFRSSAIWTRKRAQILQRDSFACKVCATRGRITARALQVHHITPLTEDFDRRTDDGNLLTLCEACHTDAHADAVTRKELYELTGKSLTELLKNSIPPT